jgi:hypothetical protein
MEDPYPDLPLPVGKITFLVPSPLRGEGQGEGEYLPFLLLERIEVRVNNPIPFPGEGRGENDDPLLPMKNLTLISLSLEGRGSG